MKINVIKVANFNDSCLPLGYDWFAVERVSTIKLLGVNVNLAPRLNDHRPIQIYRIIICICIYIYICIYMYICMYIYIYILYIAHLQHCNIILT